MFSIIVLEQHFARRDTHTQHTHMQWPSVQVSIGGRLRSEDATDIRVSIAYRFLHFLAETRPSLDP